MKNFSLDSKFFLAITTAITAAFLAHLLFPSNSKSKSLFQCSVFLFIYISIADNYYKMTVLSNSFKRLIISSLFNSLFCVPSIYPVILCKRIVLSFSLLLFCFSHHYHINPRTLYAKILPDLLQV
jgi:hypothetical protein